MTDIPQPRLYVTVPGVEDLTTVVEMLRGAGAVITDNHREFVIVGPLTPAQAASAWQLTRHTDNGDRMGVRVEPDGDVRAALDTMCAAGWESSDFVEPEGDYHASDDWWVEQQGIQSRRRRAGNSPATPVVTTPPAPVPVGPPPEPLIEVRTDGTCCGRRAWSPKEGEPVVNGCQMCSSSRTYWRTARASS